MYNILVVDDESRHRSGLANMIRGLKSDYKVSEAKNGEDALNFINANSVDIAITDIKMPIMDGLQLIENLGQKVRKIKIIILSAYGYFEYAQKAMNHGVFGFLLKPVDDAKVSEILNKAENEIVRENIENQEKEGLRKQLLSTLPVYVSSQLNKWISGNLSKSDMDEIKGIFPFNGMGTVIISELKNFESAFANCSNEELEKLELNLKTWVDKSLDPLGNSISFFHQDEGLSLITVLNLERKSGLLSKDNIKGLNEVISNLKTEYGIDATIALGNTSQNIFGDICDVYNNAKKALGFKFFLEDDNIIAFSSIESFGKKQVFVRFKEEEELTDAIRKLDKQKAVGIIDDIIGKMVSDGYPVASRFKDAVIHILLNQVKMIQNAVNEEKFYFLTEDRLNTLRQCTNYSEFNIIIRQIIYDLISSLNDHKGRKNELIFSKCMEYIERNYSEDLSLETLAETFYFNPSYFSTLFKNYTRVNFSQYLLNLRMKKGKELLEKTDYKVYEVAARIGYKDSKYFNRVFKKEFGVTPDEYRRI